MNENGEKRKIAFPIAAIVGTIYLLLNILRLVLVITHLGGRLSTETLLFYLGEAALLVVLFLRKRKWFLIIPIALIMLVTFYNIIYIIT